VMRIVIIKFEFQNEQIIKITHTLLYILHRYA